ncbi:hypothetical protein R3P38DRAFT_3493641 [Favolaschia claudopus]|uniref:Uncharacterized protein n=1 Tax=Favolaschia claudopus TaxID=2862362 RepID=A0AAW0C8Q4_9AGAR
MRRHPTQSGLPGPSNLRGAPGNAYDAGGNHNLGIYGEGAPYGNPFVVPLCASKLRFPLEGLFIEIRVRWVMVHPRACFSFLIDTLSNKFARSTTPKQRSVSFDTPKGASSLQGRNAAFLRATSANDSANANFNSSSLNTPKQANYRHAPAQSMIHPQFRIQEEQSPMEMLLDTIQLLRGDMHEVKQRLGALETSISELQRPTPIPSRGLAAQRGTRMTRSKGATPRIPSRPHRAPAAVADSDAESTADDVSAEGSRGRRHGGGV